MSFLQNLQDRKVSLKHTDTLVTCADGKRYIEKHSSPNSPIVIPQLSTIGFVIDTAPDDIPALVVPNLFVGSQDCCFPGTLLKFNIEYVLSVGIESPHIHPAVKYDFVECLDLPETDLLHVFAKCNPILKCALNMKKNILVHCNAGVSRSASVVIGYLMQELHMSYEDAHRLLKSVRPCIQPNPGFTKQLKRLSFCYTTLANTTDPFYIN